MEAMGLTEMGMPIGYRFKPTDEELITYYLMNKASDKPLPADIIKDIDATHFYSNHPTTLVANSLCEENEWYFFLHWDRDFQGEGKKSRAIGNEMGFWKTIGGEERIYNSDGNVLAFKVYLVYFSGPISQPKKTDWEMEEYRLPFENNTNDLKGAEWMVGRLKSGADYDRFA